MRGTSLSPRVSYAFALRLPAFAPFHAFQGSFDVVLPLSSPRHRRRASRYRRFQTAAPLGSLGLSAARHELALSWPIYENFGQNWIVLGQIAFALIEISAAVLLLQTRSWVSAVILLACCVFVISVLFATMAHVVTAGDNCPMTAGEYVLLLVTMLFFVRLIWRAMYAAPEIRRLQLSEPFI